MLMAEWSPMAAVDELIGREVEAELIEQLLGRLPELGGALVVRGDAGIGKSALLRQARERARALHMRTLVTAGVESEAELAFAGLHQLLYPILVGSGRLAGPLRGSLEAAFGVAGGSEPDPFRVAVAAFHLLCDSAETAPLVLIVDDAHWLDRSSLEVLSFVARRLESEPVVLVAGARGGRVGPLDHARLPTLDLDRLSPAAAAEMLDRRAPELHPIVRARVLAEAAGNPLALVELARLLPDRPALRSAFRRPRPLSPRVSSKRSRAGLPTSRRRPGRRCWPPRSTAALHSPRFSTAAAPRSPRSIRRWREGSSRWWTARFASATR